MEAEQVEYRPARADHHRQNFDDDSFGDAVSRRRDTVDRNHRMAPRVGETRHDVNCPQPRPSRAETQENVQQVRRHRCQILRPTTVPLA